MTDPGYVPATISAVHDLLVAWGAAGYQAASGVNPDDNTPLPASGPIAAEAVGRAGGAHLQRLPGAASTTASSTTSSAQMQMGIPDSQQESRAIRST